MKRLSALGNTKSLAGYILVALIALNLLLHLPFLLLNTFGESDAARVALVSLQLAYHQEGPQQVYQDAIYSAPFYIALVRQGLQVGLIRPANIIVWMTITSYVASAVVTAMVFVFIFNLTGSIMAASGAGVLLQLNPTFWFNSLYGFPTILAIAFLFLALIFFQTGLSKTPASLKAIMIGSAFILFLLAILMKIDVFLAGVIFCLPVWRSATKYKLRLIWLAALMGLALGSFWLYSQYTRGLLSNQLASAFYGDWNVKFPIDVGYFFSRDNLEIIFRSAGIFSLPLAAIASPFLAKDQTLRPVLTWISAAALVLVVFWGVREGNSARHNLLPDIFLVMLLALPLSTKLHIRWGVLLVLMCIGNYFVLPPQVGMVAPTGRLATNSILLQEARLNLHNRGRTIANLTEDKVAVIGEGPLQPYYLFEIFRDEDYTYINTQPDPESRIPETLFLHQGQPSSFLWSYDYLPTTEIVRLIERGYFALISDPGTATELEKTIRGGKTHWLSIENLR
ncbi:MAG TPA: hypothetical protein VLA49_10435 [Anaerolineales bacterium]|nr:hypothetical protein [Anaerolineales bacterium]